MKNLVFLFCVHVLYCSCQDLHLIEPKPGLCYDVYQSDRPIYLSKRSKSCVELIPETENCFGLTTQNKEVIILKCDKDEKLDPGCYKIINQDKTEGTVCQKISKGKGCEIITTPTSLYVEVFCHPIQPQGRTIVLNRDSGRKKAKLAKDV